MIFPQKWMLKRPGILIPVFFLSLCPSPATGQLLRLDVVTAALGGAIATPSDFSTAGHNQASLGWIEQNSVTILHCRPFVIKELGISSLSGQLNTGRGAFGTTITSFGIDGLRQTSTWISYGMKLFPGVSAGVGIHLWTSSISEKILYQPGISFALGIQTRITDKWILGAHVLHPVGWSTSMSCIREQTMVISAGSAYLFFETATWYSEMRFRPESQIQFCNGIEWTLNDRLGLLFGIHNQPFTFSGGISLLQSNWTIQIAFQYIFNTGTSPLTSLRYAW